MCHDKYNGYKLIMLMIYVKCNENQAGMILLYLPYFITTQHFTFLIMP